MGDGAAERAGRSALDVDVDPLVVTGGVGEPIHAVLVDLQPVAAAELLTGQVGEGVEVVQDAHRCSCSGRIEACPNLPASRSATRPRCCCTTISTEASGRRPC